MALPPTIPTSFVPKQPVATTSKHRTTGTNPFLILSYFIVSIAVVGCLAVFGYQYYLEGVAKHKASDVITAQRKIDQATVTDFIRLRDRFTAAKELLNSHVTLSQFFDVLEHVTLQGVRFTSLKLSVTDDRTAKIEMNGTAKTFNALAAQSSLLATDKRIKRAIFSGITVAQKDSTVSFSLTADIDPSLVTLSTAGPGTSTPPVTTIPVNTQQVLVSTSTARATTTP